MRMRRSGVLAAALCIAVVGCGEGEPQSDATEATAGTGTGTVAVTTATTATTGGAGAETRADCGHADASSPATFDPAQGAYAANVVAYDDGSPTVTFDVVQWLIGQDAVDAYHRENPADPEGPPNDYFVVNDNPLARTATLGDNAMVWLVRQADTGTTTVKRAAPADLADYLAESPPEAIYWLTFSNGTIVELCEQFTP